jgi:PucR family transcriptional regulator, purine catabolism regulatory protein
MALTLRDLVSTPELGLRLLAEGPDVDRAVTWVHVSELRDPTPFLSGGELLLTTGLTIDAGLDLDAYVRRLAAAAVVGLGFGTGLSHAEVPAGLVAAARRHGLPILEVPMQTPFIAISRAVSAAAAAAEYASVTRTFTAQQALTKAALAASGPDRLVRLLAQQVLGWVVLLDPSGAPIAAHPDSSRAKVDVLAAEMAVLAAHRGTVSSSFPLGADTVSLQSVGTGPRGRAFLAAGRPGPLSAADRHLVNAAVMLLTIRLEQTSTMDAGLGMLRAAVLRLYLAGQAELAGPIAEQLSMALPSAPITVLVAIGDIAGIAGELGDSTLPSADRVLIAELDDVLVAAVGGGEDAASDVAARVVLAGPDLPRGIAVGISAPSAYADIALAHRHARQAADFGQRRGRAFTRFSEIAMPGITGMLPPEAALAFAESLLGPLVAHDVAGRGDLVDSLRTWLAHHGQWDPAAAALGVHRHTLRHRMRTVEGLLGHGLDSPGVRAELWLALSVLDSGEVTPSST